MTSQPQMPSAVLNTWINGLTGRMGKAISTAISQTPELNLLGGSSKEYAFDLKMLSADVILDFSLPEASEKLATFLETNHSTKPVIVGTTGLTQTCKTQWETLGKKAPILIAPNTSLGILLLNHALSAIKQLEFIKKFDVTIQETHHTGKKDAPSGTALLLAQQLDMGTVPIESLRAGDNPGEHLVKLTGPYEQITLGHQAFSRELFAHGALTLSKWLTRQAIGCYHINQVNLF